MDNIQKYHLDEKKFRKAYNLADTIYSTAVVIRDYCRYHEGEENLLNIMTIVNFLKNQADNLLYFFTNVDMECDENEWEGWLEDKCLG